MDAFSRTEGTLHDSPFHKRATVTEETILRVRVTGFKAIARVPETPSEAGQRGFSNLLKARVKGNMLRALLP